MTRREGHRRALIQLQDSHEITGILPGASAWGALGRLLELLLRLCRGFLLGASPLEYALHGVIALMTRVLIDWP